MEFGPYGALKTVTVLSTQTTTRDDNNVMTSKSAEHIEQSMLDYSKTYAVEMV